MINIKALLRFYFKPANRKKFLKIISLRIIGILMIIGFSAFFAVTNYKIYPQILRLGLAKQYLNGMIWGANLLIFIILIFSIPNKFFLSRYNKIFLPMPIKPREIVTAKLITLLISNYMLLLIVLGPFISFGICSKASLIYYMYLLIILLVMPIYPFVILFILTLLIYKYFNLIKFKKYLGKIVSTIGFVGWIAIVVSLELTRKSQVVQSIHSHSYIFNILNYIILPNKFAMIALENSNNIRGVLGVGVLIGISIIGIIIAFIIADKGYIQVLIDIDEKDDIVISKEKKKKINYNTNSKLKSLVIADLKNVLRNKKMFNTQVIGGLKSIIIYVVILGISNKVPINKFTGLLAVAGTGIITTFSVFKFKVGASSILREGEKRFAMIKTLPINSFDYILSKVIVAFIFNLIVIPLLILMMIYLGFNGQTIVISLFIQIGIIGFMSILSVMATCIKFDETDFLKNRRYSQVATIITLIGGVLLSLIIIGVDYGLLLLKMKIETFGIVDVGIILIAIGALVLIVKKYYRIDKIKLG